ncbi:C45 family peptidase [Nisaea acidiphila]|uniref:C45 family peptidase n=1 Tax=Nisaea acidiphila TaxID=1862145 RepID=A0A9J7AUN1_9PROT|nr:C45 family peptidase [Nisaea acidiphila]UUX51031.1 C45 family peptidase [Nisaea acidiphila]
MDQIIASGTPYDLGQALGRKGRQAIAEASFATPQFRALEQWLGSERLKGLEVSARTSFPEFVREIEGIADGAEQPFEKIFLWNCRGDLRDLVRSDEDACTSLMLPAADGRPARLAHNEDGAPELAGQGFIAHFEPDISPAFDAYCYPGMLPGHAFGWNAAGIVQTINNIRPHDLTVGVPRHVITRAVLAAETIDEALELLKRTDRASGFHHNLADGSGRMVSVEAPASGFVAEEVSAPHAHANHLIRGGLAHVEQTISESSRQRQERADAMLAAGERDPLTILFDRTVQDNPILCRAEREASDSYTLATFACSFGSDGMEWGIYHGPDRKPVLRGGLDRAA